MVEPSVPKPAPGNYNSIAAQYARAKALKDAEDAKKVQGVMADSGLDMSKKPKNTVERWNEKKADSFRREWGWVLGFFVWLL
jgi:GPI ethanolamine phosphate transferase 3 subunit O